MKIPIELIERENSAITSGDLDIKKLVNKVSKSTARELDPPEFIERRKAMIATVVTEDVFDAHERYIGTNDLLPINYLLTGYKQSRSVGLVRYFDKEKQRPVVATGFLIAPGLLLTNHHVFPAVDAAEFVERFDDATVDFDHEYDTTGSERPSVPFLLEPDRFFYSYKELDIALVAVAPKDLSAKRSLTEQGYLVLNGKRGKAGYGDFATIIQHPKGERKKIALRKNDILPNKLDADNELPDHVLVYSSDTAQGSSGASVHNDQWQVIALHSSGVPRRKAGQIVDKDNNVLDTSNKEVDGEKVDWICNSGIRISSIMAHLSDPQFAVSREPMVLQLFSSAYTDASAFLGLSDPNADRVVKTAESGTGHAVGGHGQDPTTVNIQITFGNGAVRVSDGRPPAFSDKNDLLQEKWADDIDYSKCAGYDEDFMGVRIPMPVPKPALKRKLAFLTDNPTSYLLRYHHISTIQHAVRRVPVVSAMNVYAKRRYDELGKDSRKDNWYPDARIDSDAQLNDAFYAKSGFDKGHLARREDAEWGTTIANAKLAADMTCSYANAAPQVPDLNRNIFGYKGLWGQLEMLLLEKGVKRESGQYGKVCMFSGPIFNDDTDPVFKGVQIALDFFKIVVWYNNDEEIRATAFRLSQKDLVSAIEFEALDADRVFVNEQRSIRSIAEATQLVFPKIILDNDTYKKGNEVLDERAILELTKQH